MGFFSKKKEENTDRPSNVPTEAVWNAANNEWELGEKNSDGNHIGHWKWWLAPNGHLVCETDFEGEGGGTFVGTRYHPSGKPSRKTHYVDNMEHGVTTFYRSDEDTLENFPIPKGKMEHIRKVALEYNMGTIVGEQFWDEDGNEVEQSIWIKKEEPQADVREYTQEELMFLIDDEQCLDEILEIHLIKGDDEFEFQIDIEESTLTLPDDSEKTFDDDDKLFKQFKIFMCNLLNDGFRVERANFLHAKTLTAAQWNELDVYKLFYCSDSDFPEKLEDFIKEFRITEEEEEIEEEETDSSSDQLSFGSVEEASQHWITEGQKFKNGLNSWLDVIYKENKNPEDPEPTDSRANMIDYVLNQIKERIASGKANTLRELFPPAHEPFGDVLDRISSTITQLLMLDNNKILVRSNGAVFLVEGEKITQQKDIEAFGSSHDKKYIGCLINGHIVITKGWKGEETARLKLPNNYGKVTKNVAVYDFSEGVEINNLDVFNDGKRALIASPQGVFVLSEEKNQCVFPRKSEIEDAVDEWESEGEEGKFSLNLDYVHAKLSPNNKFIATGHQSSSHAILMENAKGKWKVEGEIDGRSEYPHAVGFHDTKNHVALNSCHAFSSSATIGVDLDLLPDFEASGYDGDEELDYIEDRFWVFSILPYKEGYLLGERNGYIWNYGISKSANDLKGYLHLGGTINCMDISADKKTLIAGTFSGHVVMIDMEQPDRDPTLITNMNVKEAKRWTFWPGVGEPFQW